MAGQSNLGYRVISDAHKLFSLHFFAHRHRALALGRLRWLTFFPAAGWWLTLHCPPPAASGNSCSGRAVAACPSLTSIHWRSSGNYCVWHEHQGCHGLSSPGLPPRTYYSAFTNERRAASQWGPEADVVSTYCVRCFSTWFALSQTFLTRSLTGTLQYGPYLVLGISDLVRFTPIW